MKYNKVLVSILIAILFIFIVNVNTSADIVNIDISFSNYGYGTGVQTSGREGISIYIKTHFRENYRYTRAGIRFHSSLNARSYYGSIGYVNRRKNEDENKFFDVGLGKEIRFSQRSAFNIEGGYTTALPENYYYKVSLNLNWPGSF